MRDSSKIFASSLRPQAAQIHRVLVQPELVVLGAVAGEVQEQDVVVAFHARGDGLDRLADGGHRRHRRRAGGAAAVDQDQRAAARAEIAVELGAHELDLAAEDLLRAVARHRQQVEVDPATRARLEAGERRIEQRPLLVERSLDVKSEALAVGGVLLEPALPFGEVLQLS